MGRVMPPRGREQVNASITSDLSVCPHDIPAFCTLQVGPRDLCLVVMGAFPHPIFVSVSGSVPSPSPMSTLLPRRGTLRRIRTNRNAAFSGSTNPGRGHFLLPGSARWTGWRERRGSMPTPSVQPRHNRRQGRRVHSNWSELKAQEHLKRDVMKAERKILMVLAMATMVSPLLAKSCGREHVEYDQTMSIVSIFVIFAVSILGFMTPAWLARRKDRDMRLIVAACTFGSTAVLFTVGIVHILGDADEDLSNECLPESFLKAFPGWSDLICCITIMVSVMFDYSMHSSLQNKIDRADALACCENGLKEPLNNGGEEEEIWDAEFPSGLDESIQRYAVLLVEVSVCTHSIPVGLDLGLQSADKFAPLFIAVIFHQVLEGFGVGAAVLNAGYGMHNQVVFGFLFALTAPVGIAIGVSLQGILNTNSPAYLMTLGIVNSIAAGMLIFIAFEHMNAFRNKGNWLRKQGLSAHLLCFGSFVVAGSALLVVAKWA